MYGKIQITGKLELQTGMHIGGSAAFAAIGAVDAPVIKDVHSNLPMIPGSPLKGKLRTLLAREYNQRLVRPDDDDIRIARLFGTSQKGNIQRSRLLFSDMVLSNEEELRGRGLQSLTEIKFENTINRMTAVANPRQIERVVRGACFDLDVIYEASDEAEVLEDMKTLGEGMRLLQYDYLGGHGSRGYGKVRFQDVRTEAAAGAVREELVRTCGEILNRCIGGQE